MKASTATCLLVLSLSLVVAGCAKPPQEVIDAAEAAFEKLAYDTDVVTYSPDSIREARELLSALQVEVAVQEKKPALARRYDEASELAANVAGAVEAARAAAQAAKRQVGIEAEARIAAAEEQVPALQTKLAQARRLRGIRLDAAAVASAIAEAKEYIRLARADVESSSFASARAKANAAQERLADLELTVNEAMLLARRRLQ